MMVLYSGFICLFSHRCRFVLYEKGMDFEIRDVDSTKNLMKYSTILRHTSIS